MDDAARTRRWVPLSVLWGLFVFVYALFSTFPYDRLGTVLADRIHDVAPDVDVEILNLSPYWITGVEADRLVIRSREAGDGGGGAPILDMTNPFARVSVLGFLTGKLKASAGGEALGGRLDARVALSRSGGKRIALEVHDLDFSKYGYLKDRFDSRVEGKLGADIDLDLLDPDPKNWKGGGEVDLAGVKLLEVVAAGYPVPPLSFESIHAELEVHDGKAVVRRTLVKGAEIDEARLSGDVSLRQQLGVSTLNLTAKLRPNATLDEQWGPMLSNFLRKKDQDGFYSLYIRGPLFGPKITK